uniref:Uncharacterized protein n=1 Tax=Trichogramma kaykai TaxID=54128 RepID=A0ABD2XJG1_9HYME
MAGVLCYLKRDSGARETRYLHWVVARDDDEGGHEAVRPNLSRARRRSTRNSTQVGDLPVTAIVIHCVAKAASINRSAQLFHSSSSSSSSGGISFSLPGSRELRKLVCPGVCMLLEHEPRPIGAVFISTVVPLFYVRSHMFSLPCALYFRKLAVLNVELFSSPANPR